MQGSNYDYTGEPVNDLAQVQSDKERAISDALTNEAPPTVNARPYNREELASLISEFADNIKDGDEDYDPTKVVNMELEKADSMAQAIRLCIGAASMCWESMSGTGVFQSEQALAIARQLQYEIQRQVGELSYSLVELIDVIPREEFVEQWLKLMRGPQSDRIIEVSVTEQDVMYPHNAGEITILGPDIFISKDGSVISHKGQNYYPDSEITRQVNQHKASVARQYSSGFAEGSKPEGWRRGDGDEG